MILTLDASIFRWVALPDLTSRGLSTDLLVLTKKGYESPSFANKKSSGLLLLLEPRHQVLSSSKKKQKTKQNILSSSKKKTKNKTKHTSLAQLRKNMHFLPLSIVASSMSTFLISVSIWELIFHTAEQQSQLPCVGRWNKVREREIFASAGIFGKHAHTY